MAKTGDFYYWRCNVCNAQNSRDDGECQYCSCEGRECKRDSCSDPKHFEGEQDADYHEPNESGFSIHPAIKR